METWLYLISFIAGSLITIFIFRIERRDRLILSEQERKDKFKLVAIEKRLEAHQQAFSHWNNLRSIIHEDDSTKRNKIINEATEFWFKNCLYLEKQTREKFNNVIFLVLNYPLFLNAWKTAEQGSEKEDKNKELLKYWDEIHALPLIIMSEVELEPISIKEEIDPFGKAAQDKKSKKM